MGGRRLLCGALLFAIAAWAPVLAEDVAVDEDLSDYELALQAMADGDEEMLKWLTILADTLEPDEDGAPPRLPLQRSRSVRSAGFDRRGCWRAQARARPRRSTRRRTWRRWPNWWTTGASPPARPPPCAAPTL